MKNILALCCALLLAGCAHIGQSRDQDHLTLHRLHLLDEYCLQKTPEERVKRYHLPALKKAPNGTRLPDFTKSRPGDRAIMGFGDEYGQETLAFSVRDQKNPASFDYCAVQMQPADAARLLPTWLVAKYPAGTYHVYQMNGRIDGRDRTAYVVEPRRGADPARLFESFRNDKTSYVSVTTMTPQFLALFHKRMQEFDDRQKH